MTAKQEQDRLRDDHKQTREELAATREVLIKFQAWAEDRVDSHEEILNDPKDGLMTRFAVVEAHQMHQCPANTKNKALVVSYCAIVVSLIAAIGQYIPSILSLLN